MATTCSVLLWLFRLTLTDSLIAHSWLLSALLSACIGLLQYFGYARLLGGWVHTTELGDAFANLRQRNQFATLTNIGLLALLWLALPKRNTEPWLNTGFLAHWMWAVPMIWILTLGNAASNSRTGMLQSVLVVALVVHWTSKLASRQIVLAVFALMAYGLSVILLPTLLEGWTGTPRGGLLARFTEEPGCASRTVLWSNVLHLIALKPWAGWGWGELDYAHFITLYPGERFCDILDNAHNLPLHLAVELGLPVAIVSMGLLTWWVLRNRPWAEQNPTRQMAWAVLAVIALHSLLEYPLWYGPFQLAVGLCVLLLWPTRQSALADLANDQAKQASNRKLRWIERVTVTLCLTLLAAAAWDYWRISQLYKLPADRAEAYRENTLSKLRNTWFFQDQVQFAELTTATLQRSNAAQIYTQAQRLLHFSPEPRVIEAAIESAVMLGKDDEAVYYLQRYKAAFPDAHAAWTAKSARFKAP